MITSSKKLEAVIFDFDGTIANTFPVVFHSHRVIFREFRGEEKTDAEIFAMFGPHEEQNIDIHFSHIEDRRPIVERLYQSYDEMHGELTPRMFEIEQVLQELTDRGVRLGVCTGKARRSFDISMRHLFRRNYFDAIVTGSDTVKPKPDPEGLRKIVDQIGLSTDNVLYVGDSDVDFQAARALGIEVVGVRWFDLGVPQIWHEMPDHQFDRVEPFRRFLLDRFDA